jgi:hypothetical protein
MYVVIRGVRQENGDATQQPAVVGRKGGREEGRKEGERRKEGGMQGGSSEGVKVGNDGTRNATVTSEERGKDGGFFG